MASRLAALAARGALPRMARAPSALGVRSNQQAAAQSHLFDTDDSVRRRLLYRSKQRGWLEMDIMLGNWAEEHLGTLDAEQLHQFQQVIDMENPELFKYLTGQEPVPADINNPLLRTLCKDLRETREPKVTVQSAAGFEGKVWE